MTKNMIDVNTNFDVPKNKIRVSKLMEEREVITEA